MSEDPFERFGNTFTGTCETCGREALTAKCPIVQQGRAPPGSGCFYLQATADSPLVLSQRWLCRPCWSRATDGPEERTIVLTNSGLGVQAELRLVRAAGTSWTANKLFVALQFLAGFTLEIASRKPEIEEKRA